MRQDLATFTDANESENAQPVVVIELSVTADNSEVIYLTSHQIDDLPAGDAYQNCVISCSSTSQNLRIINFSSTVGAVNALVGDDGTLSDYLRAKLGEGKTVSNNRFRLYAGFSTIPFSDFSVVQTQIVQNVGYDNGAIRFRCQDIQRESKKTIFDPKITILTSNLSESDTTINVQNASGFETVWHGSSYSDAPNQKVGYLILRDDDDDYEIIRYTGKTATTFTGITRGAMGTLPRSWEALDSDGESNELEIEEFIYIELPVVKLAYAILTGNLYGDAGEGFPEHWHLDIDEQWVSTSKFVNIGADIWDTTDDSAGRVCLFNGLQKESGRRFITDQLMPLISCFMPISAMGELGLKRITSVLSDAPYDALLNKENILDISEIKYAQDEIKNRLLVDWSYDFIKERFRRASLFFNTASHAIYQWRPEKTLALKGMHGTRHSRDFMKGTFSAFSDRFAFEPIYCKVQLAPGLSVLEVADTARLQLEGFQDYTAESDLNRTFEVQGVKTDWVNSSVSVDLFGSSAKPGALPDDGEGYTPGFAIEDSTLTSAGSNIESAFSANTSRDGDLVTLDSDITFSGAESVTLPDGTLNPAAILFCDGDLLIPTGVKLNFTGNMILVYTGFLTVNGEINGVGGGHAGGDYRRTYVNQHAFVPVESSDWALTKKIAVDYDSVSGSYSKVSPGYLHQTMKAQGGFILMDYPPDVSFVYAFDYASIESSNAGEKIVSDFSEFAAIPSLEFDPLTLVGLPTDLRGGGGPAGDHIFKIEENNPNASNTIPFFNGQTLPVVAHGSNGGNGGGGLVTIGRGMGFGLSGKVDLSGGDADGSPESYLFRNETFYAGAGCGGAPGAWICLIDGGDSVAPLVESGNYVCEFGDSENPGNQIQYIGDIVPGLPGLDVACWIFGSFSSIPQNNYPGNNHHSKKQATSSQFSGVNFWQTNHRVQYILPPNEAPGEPLPADVVAPPVTAISLTENTNTPQTPAGNRSSVDILVTPPASTAYAYSRVYVRLQGSAAWDMLPVAAENETVLRDVPSDGATWEIQARSVSKSGYENSSGPVQTITLSNKGANENYELVLGYDESTDTFARVIDTSDDSVVVSLSGNGGAAGKVSAGAGSSGYDNFTDIPQSLADINPTEYQDILDDIAAAELGSGITTFWQGTEPSSGMGEGDLWYDTSNGNHPHRYTSGSWVDAQDSEIAAALAAAATAQTTADGKMVVFTSGPAAPTADGVGDLWVYGGETKVWNGSAWVLGGDITSQNTANDTNNVNGVPATTITANIAQALAEAAAAQNTADGKVTIFYGGTAPSSGMDTDDLWFNPENTPYRYDGSGWVAIQDQGIAQALANAATAQATADGKISVFSGAGTPTADGVGDLWDNGTIVRRWDGVEWVQFADDTQTAIDNEIITTGGLVLSTDGAVRTAGKSGVDDGTAGVFLGNNGGDNVFEIGDGQQKRIMFDGNDLVIGRDTKIVGHSLPSKGGYRLQVERFSAEDYTENVSGTIVTGLSTDGIITLGFLSTTNENDEVDIYRGTSILSFAYINFTKNLTLKTKVFFSNAHDELDVFIGMGAYSQNTSSPGYQHIGFLVKNGDLYYSIRDSGLNSTTEVYISALPEFINAGNEFGIYVDYLNNKTVYFYLNGSLVATSENDINFPEGGTTFANRLFLLSARANTDMTDDRLLQLQSFYYEIEE